MKEQTTKKIFVEKEIFRLQSEYPICWKELKHIKFEDDDKIEVFHDEGYYSENNSWDPHFCAIVSRKILETDDEFNKRIQDNEAYAKRSSEQRYQNYLKLKQEFENIQ